MMNRINLFLTAGGVISVLIAILHIVLSFQPQWFLSIIGSQQETETGLSRMAVEGSGVITAVSIGLSVIFVVWALYAFSGAGLIGRLPLLQTGQIVIAAIYLLRSLFLFTEVNMVLNQGYPMRFVLYSTISLVAGLCYLGGILLLRSEG